MISANKSTLIRPRIIALALLLLLCTTVSAQELTADQLIAKNIEAAGGSTAWAGVKAIKMTGTYTNFSDPENFTLYRQRPDLYRFDCKRINAHTVHAYDGETAWWVNPIMGPEYAKPCPIPIEGNLDKVTHRERFFEPVFWNYQRKGNSVEMLGKTQLDGEAVYQLKITLKDSTVENWFFSAESFLAVSMTGMTYDFGTPNSVETFFTDYREVKGVKLPYLIESEYGIRYRVYEIDEIAINPALEPDLFQRPSAEAWKQQQ